MVKTVFLKRLTIEEAEEKRRQRIEEKRNELQEEKRRQRIEEKRNEHKDYLGQYRMF